MSKILVTGGAGFIGSNLVDRLIDLGHEVVVIDNLFTGKRDYLNPRAKFYEIDICDPEVKNIFSDEKFEYVYHLAAQIDVRISVDDPALDNKINILGSLNILQNCLDFNVSKIIFASSGGAIYGFPEEIPTPESYMPYPVSPYGINKLCFEKYLNYYYRVFGQKYTSLRLANVYGPRQYKGGEAGVVSIFINSAVREEEASIFGDGLQTRDFTYVDDIVEAFIAAMKKEVVGDFNIGTGLEKSLIDIVSAIENSIGEKMKIKHLDSKKGEERRSCLKFDKAKNILGWEARVELTDGISRTISWSKKQLKNKNE
jgi:UDP-glucose 4-epimerase